MCLQRQRATQRETQGSRSFAFYKWMQSHPPCFHIILQVFNPAFGCLTFFFQGPTSISRALWQTFWRFRDPFSFTSWGPMKVLRWPENEGIITGICLSQQRIRLDYGLSWLNKVLSWNTNLCCGPKGFLHSLLTIVQLDQWLHLLDTHTWALIWACGWERSLQSI